jgi:hypothetical protein
MITVKVEHNLFDKNLRRLSATWIRLLLRP